MTNETMQATSLYDRVGGGERLRSLIGQVVDAHLANPAIQARFHGMDRAQLTEGAFGFFAAAMGGPEPYTGRGLVEVHRGMNVNEQEFVAATDDLMAVLQRNNVAPQEQMELLAAFFAMKEQVLHL